MASGGTQILLAFFRIESSSWHRPSSSIGQESVLRPGLALHSPQHYVIDLGYICASWHGWHKEKCLQRLQTTDRNETSVLTT